MADRIVKNRMDSLSRDMYRNNILNYLFRGLGITFGLLETKVNLGYLGSNLYGVWITISSIASWINYGDLGIGHGLRNQLSQADANEDTSRQKSLVATGCRALLRMSVIMLLILTLVTELIFGLNIMNPELRIPMYITNVFFSANMFLGIGRPIAYGFQMSWLTTMAQVSTVILRIAGILMLGAVPHTKASLIRFAVVYGFAGVLGDGVLLLVLFFKTKWKNLKGLKRYYDVDSRKSISQLGIKFFALQLVGLVLYSTDNLIINKLFDGYAVTRYTVITKIYNTGNSLFSILLVSLWSAVTYAAARNDFKWIKREVRRLLALWGLFFIGVVIVSVLLNPIVAIWLGKDAIHYDRPIIILFAVYLIMTSFGSIFVNVTNGLGRLRIQIMCGLLASVINVPLSVFFAKTLGMGIFGVKLATLFCCFGSIIVIPLDIVHYLKEKRS